MKVEKFGVVNSLMLFSVKGRLAVVGTGEKYRAVVFLKIFQLRI